MDRPVHVHPDSSALFYEIRAKGALDEGWSPRLNGLEISVDSSEPGHPVTVLTGDLEDEAALNGVLRTLYALGLALLSVQSRPVHER
jgi:hypothetical protein